VGGVAQTDQGAGMLYQNMLKPASRTDERNPTLACRLNDRVDPFGVDIGTSRTDHDTVTRILDQSIVDPAGGNRANVHVHVAQR
jgi:hypothetical protein